ncbi:hypothetical protein BH11ARM2_BH11ARM2_08150 [soil metagenome]
MMRRPFLYCLLLTGAAAALAAPLRLLRSDPVLPVGWNMEHNRFTLPNGWRLTPVGRSVTLPGDMPATILLMDGGKRALVNTCGFHDQSLSLINLDEGKIVGSVPFDRSWIGLCQGPGGDLLVSGGKVEEKGKNEAIHRVSLTESGLAKAGDLPLPGVDRKEQFVSSLLSGAEGIYALNVQSDAVLLLAPDGTKKASAKVGYRPYAAALSPDGETLAVSNWGNKSVSLLDARTLKDNGRVAVGSHPTALLYTPDGRLFVTNAGADTFSVIEKGRVSETVRVGLDPSHPIGATPVALALSPDAKTLYVADAGENCVGVVDVSRPGRSRRKGLIPTERYPTALAVTPDGKRLLIGTAKGYYGPNAGEGVDLGVGKTEGKSYGAPFRYIGDQLAGRLTVVDVPEGKTLARLTKQAIENSPLGLAAAATARERKAVEAGAFKNIKHIVYVIRENRTYDQVLGDIPKGNGDPHLTIFGEKVTPNGHKLANTFVLLDNLYTDGEVSQAGHQWTDAAYANDYTEKQWILDYSDHGEVQSDKRLTSSPGDYLWSAARKKGHWARVYGEYVDVQEDHDSLESEEIKKEPEKYGYSASFEKIFARGGRDTEKVDDFLREMREGEKTGKWPALMVMALPEDHTHGFSPGALSPYAMVANNDLAVGRLIDAVSHSVFWKSTAFFIIQDDAQDGPDHVDSHRTVGLVVSPYVRRGGVDHTHYTTASMLRTMETILGLPPMTEYDAKATPMHNVFLATPDLTPYTLEPPRVDVEERNPKGTLLARRSSKLDFSEVDRADFGELNHILWEGYRPGQPYPDARKRR